MKILYVGAFNNPASADYPRAMGLIKQNHTVKCLDYRYDKKKSYKYSKYNKEKRIQYEDQAKPLNIKKYFKIIYLKLNTIKNRFSSKNIIPRYDLFKNWRLGRELINEVKNNNYDLVFLPKIDSVNYKVISKINKYSKTWYFFVDPLYIALKMKAYNYASMCTWSSATFSSVNRLFKRYGANSYHITEGYNSRIFKLARNDLKKKNDLIFTGSISPKREVFITFLKENKINVRCYGNGWKDPAIYLTALADKYRKAKIILNFTRGNIGFSDRVLLAMGTGTFLLSEYCKDLEKFFKKGVHLEWFKTPKELLDLAKYYLENSEIRENIAHEGWKNVYSHFSWIKIMEKVIRIVNSKTYKNN